ncbi:2,3-dihydro-2,3-dihydroxybenzoate dehydrogenase [Zooshikella marina]|uniref:2,3-dihydro-2,3-dihydroxybenzoate dehydrogenase n=1 Tax=Zooshikella ganghwensis TaxID=202772 RepID=UPI001BAF4E9F|nr:2,3-dihydro-2,3-dihydroxybenzoate dehydrogenase [Zooshikella ganghwensis]MBU2708321.1 2,3-dihydro-2,3-dihydroxybenzoate dehydrogenase [Zooshikella ganghwensis]
MNFNKDIIVVSGAANGIGLATVNHLLDTGAHVVALDNDKAALNVLSEKKWLNKLNLYTYQVDVSNSHEVEQAIQHVEENIGAINKLVCSSGILRMGALNTLSDEDWHSTFAVNTTGVFNLCRAVTVRMQQRQSGAIVAVSSNAASVPRANMGAYAASKAAVTSFIKCLGLELAAANIRCNIVSPGSTDTQMQRQLWTDDSGPQRVIDGDLANHRLGIPLQKIATVDDIAQAILFLLSDQAHHITMHDLRVDGGATLGC